MFEKATIINLPLIVLTLLKTSGYFRYVDGWKMNFVNWAAAEPSKEKPCVYIDIDGEWKTDFCNQTMNSICMQTSGLFVIVLISSCAAIFYTGSC